MLVYTIIVLFKTEVGRSKKHYNVSVHAALIIIASSYVAS